MHLPRLLPVLFLFSCGAAFAADPGPAPEFRGEIDAGNNAQYILALPGSNANALVSIGETFAGWKLTGATQDTLTLTKDGIEVAVQMAASVITTPGAPAGAGRVAAPRSTKPSLADAEDVLNRMHFDQVIAGLLAQQKKAATLLVEQLSAKAGVSGPSAEVRAFQSRLLDTLSAGLNADSMRGEIARAYADVFTKEELQGLAYFYSTPTGQALVDKQPEISQKMMQIMTEHLTDAMPKVEQEAKDFAAEQAAKKKVAANTP